MVSLYDRAGQRCEQNILRRYPAWRQANLTEADRPEFDAWVQWNKAHLSSLRDQIVRGETPDIDRGWPTGTAPAFLVPEGPKPSVVEVMESAKQAIDRVAERREPEIRASYSFKPEFLAEEAQEGEDLKATDMRLLQTYEQLELLRPTGLDAAEEARRIELFRNFYDYKGPA